MLGLSRIFVIVSRASASANRIEEVLTAPEDLAVLPAGDAPETFVTQLKARERAVLLGSSGGDRPAVPRHHQEWSVDAHR